MAPPVLPGNMQGWPLLCNKILDYAAKWHAEQEIVTKTVEGPITITTYADLQYRSQLCALALRNLGVSEGTMVATMAWNGVRHMEAWYGIMGLGAVVHTLNPRLSDKDVKYIMNDAKDVLLLADTTFAPQLARILPHVPSCAAIIFLTDRQHMPQDQTFSCPVYCFEGTVSWQALSSSCIHHPIRRWSRKGSGQGNEKELWEAASSDLDSNAQQELLGAQAPALTAMGSFKWVEVDENAACGLCYTSGTTGNPKGVLYSHRAQFLHAMLVLQSDSVPLNATSTCLAIVPMFHANVWGLVFAAPMVGARLVMPGPWLDGASLYGLIESFKVTISAGVPTVWLSLLNYLDSKHLQFTTFKTAVIGGAAPPRSMIEALENKYGLEVRHLWGMTELTPVGTIGGVRGGMQTTPAERMALKTKQGRPHVLCDMRIIDDDGKVLPHDGRSIGHLQVKGPHTVERYLHFPKPAVDEQSWFSTGDMATIDRWGYMAIADRSKDVIKSGGEWISSIEIENLAMSHRDVLEAAVIAIPNPRWGERPLLVVVPRPELPKDGLQHEQLRDQLYKMMESQLAKFAVPDDVVFVEEIPHNATGKVSKMTLREMFKDHRPARARM